MTVLDAINNIDKSKENLTGIDQEGLLSEFEIHSIMWFEEEDEGFTAYWLYNNYCTDQWVGSYVIFFNDEPVAIATKKYRKSDTKFSWLSKKAFNKVHKKLVEIIQRVAPIQFDIQENFEMPEYYQIDFGAQLLLHHKENSFDIETGNKVEIVKIFDNHMDSSTWKNVKIKWIEGPRENKSEVVLLTKIGFKFHVTK